MTTPDPGVWNMVTGKVALHLGHLVCHVDSGLLFSMPMKYESPQTLLSAHLLII